MSTEEPLCNMVGRRITVQWGDYTHKGIISGVFMKLHPVYDISLVADVTVAGEVVQVHFPLSHEREDGLTFSFEDEVLSVEKDEGV